MSKFILVSARRRDKPEIFEPMIINTDNIDNVVVDEETDGCQVWFTGGEAVDIKENIFGMKIALEAHDVANPH